MFRRMVPRMADLSENMRSGVDAADRVRQDPSVANAKEVRLQGQGCCVAPSSSSTTRAAPRRGVATAPARASARSSRGRPHPTAEDYRRARGLARTLPRLPKRASVRAGRRTRCVRRFRHEMPGSRRLMTGCARCRSMTEFSTPFRVPPPEFLPPQGRKGVRVTRARTVSPNAPRPAEPTSAGP